MKIWFCSVHDCPAYPDPYGVKLEGEAPDECYAQVWTAVQGFCRMIQMELTPVDSTPASYDIEIPDFVNRHGTW